MPRNLSLFHFFENLKTLENLIFSDIFWKVKSTENIVFSFKFLSFRRRNNSEVFTIFSAQENISLFHIFRYPKISENSRKLNYVQVVRAVKSKENMTFSV